MPRLRRRIAAFLRRHAAGDPHTRLLVAVSGGIDSVVLLDLLANLHPRPALVIAHLDHGIRGAEGRRDAAWVRALAHRLRLPCVTGRANVPAGARATGQSLEMAARTARYEFLQRTARRRCCTLLLTAHHADDQAETVLLRLFRGGGPDALAGMPAKAQLQGCTLLRPLLDTDRAEIRDYAVARKLTWCEDSTNVTRDPLRNRIRLDVLPFLVTHVGPHVPATIHATARRARQEADELERTAQAALQHGRNADGTLAVPDVRRLPPWLRRRVLRRWLLDSGVAPEHLHESLLERTCRLCETGTGTRSIQAGGHLCVTRTYDTLACAPESSSSEIVPWSVPIPGVRRIPALGIRICTRTCRGFERVPPAYPGALPARAVLSTVVLKLNGLTVRAWRPGDRIRPIGLAGSRKLQDIFTDAKIPLAQRARIPVFESGNRIVWVPGYRIAAAAALPDSHAPGVCVTVTRLPRKQTRRKAPQRE